MKRIRRSHSESDSGLDRSKIIDFRTSGQESSKPRHSMNEGRVGPRIIEVGKASGATPELRDGVAMRIRSRQLSNTDKGKRRQHVLTIPTSPLDENSELHEEESRHSSGPSTSDSNGSEVKRDSHSGQKRKTKDEGKQRKRHHSGAISQVDRLNNNSQVHAQGTTTEEQKQMLPVPTSERTLTLPLPGLVLDEDSSNTSGHSGSSNTLTPEHRLRSHSSSSEVSLASDDSAGISEHSAFLGSSATHSTRSTTSSTGLQWLFGHDGETSNRRPSDSTSPSTFRRK